LCCIIPESVLKKVSFGHNCYVTLENSVTLFEPSNVLEEVDFSSTGLPTEFMEVLISAQKTGRYRVDGLYSLDLSYCSPCKNTAVLRELFLLCPRLCVVLSHLPKGADPVEFYSRISCGY
jgi:hypothetical protein